MHKLYNALGLGLAGLLAMAAPATAQLAPPATVPEPGTLSLLTVGICGAYLVGRYLRRK